MAKHLRAVGEGETKEEDLSITDAADRGSVRQQLAALRQVVACAIEDPNCPSRDLASLSRRMIELTKEIDAIDVRVREEADEDAEASPDEEWEAV